MDSLVFWTIIIACATCLYVIVSLGMWIAMLRSTKLTRDIFNASHRPYIGVVEFKVVSGGVDKFFSLFVHFKNFGEVPARNMIAKWEVVIDNSPQQMEPVPPNPDILFPDVSSGFAGKVSGDVCDTIANGTSTLDVTLEVSYQGVTEQTYTTKQQARYKPKVNQLVPFKGEWT